MQAYCVKCRAKREMRDARVVIMKNGRPATQGVCPVCGINMFRIAGKAIAIREPIRRKTKFPEPEQLLYR